MPDRKVPRGNSPHRRRPNSVTGCPLTAALAAIGGKWKMIIIYWLAEEPAHFAALRRKMPAFSQEFGAAHIWNDSANARRVLRRRTGSAS